MALVEKVINIGGEHIKIKELPVTVIGVLKLIYPGAVINKLQNQ
ncbi:hypothetical protein HNQ02_003231 [Flavobacterium sp. 7E]|nr:hypothetical protein [Flavobacterium sp. 7E]NRS90293.1 hypothetical protein [Flavobacterium sp. 7E]